MDFNAVQSREATGSGTGGFAVGLSAKYQKDFAFNEYAADVFRQSARQLYKEQAGIADTWLNERTGGLLRQLKSAPFTVSSSPASATLVLSYLLKIRFLDMGKTGKGRKKRVYAPIYNRIVWGFVYGRIYKLLRYGFTAQVKEQYINKLREIYKQAI